MTNDLTVVSLEQMQINQWRKSLALDRSSGQISEASVTSYKRGMNKFMEWIASNGIQRVSADTVKEWFALLLSKKFMPTTINSWFAGVRHFYK